jgi:hypothetical protein
LTGHLIKQVLDRSRPGRMGSAVEAIETVRQSFSVSIVPKLANVDWSHDSALKIMRLPGVDVPRRIGLLERTRQPHALHRRAQGYFDVSSEKRADKAVAGL